MKTHIKAVSCPGMYQQLVLRCVVYCDPIHVCEMVGEQFVHVHAPLGKPRIRRTMPRVFLEQREEVDGSEGESGIINDELGGPNNTHHAQESGIKEAHVAAVGFMESEAYGCLGIVHTPLLKDEEEFKESGVDPLLLAGPGEGGLDLPVIRPVERSTGVIWGIVCRG